MAKAYRFSFGKKMRYLYLPSLLPYFAAACSTGIGIGWKAGIAAEVLGLPKNSIGKALCNAKIYCGDAGSVWLDGCDYPVEFAVRKAGGHACCMHLPPGWRWKRRGKDDPDQRFAGSHYGEKPVLSHFSHDLPDNGIVCLTGASGRGEDDRFCESWPDWKPRTAAALPDCPAAKLRLFFKEDRLLPWITARQNNVAWRSQPGQNDQWESC